MFDVDVDQADNVVFLGETHRDIDLGGGVIAADAGFFVAKPTPDGSHVFSDVYQTDFTVAANAISAAPSGDVVVTGQFWGTLQIGSLSSITAVGTQAYYDIFVAALAPDGTPQRLKRFGDDAEQEPMDVVVSGAGDVFLASSFTCTFDFGPPNATTVSSSSFYSLALVKLTSTGFPTHGWTRQLGTDVYSVRLAQAPSNGLYVAGGLGDTLDIDAPALDSANGGAFIARLDADGVQVFARAFDAPVGDQDPAAVGVGPAGSTSVGVNFDGQADFGTGTLNSQGEDDMAVIRYAAP